MGRFAAEKQEKNDCRLIAAKYDCHKELAEKKKVWMLKIVNWNATK